MDKTSIKNILKNILHEKFNVIFHEVGKNYDQADFFGQTMHLDTRDLTYLFFILEEHFNITFTENDVDNEHFYCIDGLAEIILSKSA